MNTRVLLDSLSFLAFVRRQKLRISVPLAVVRLRGVVEVLGIVKQRHFTGNMTDYGNDAIVSDKFQQLQQIIFARAEISPLGEISYISRRRPMRIFFDGLLKDVIANAA